MPRALVLARHFPPFGGAGVHRTLGSVRHLPDRGYVPVVVTGPGRASDRWSRGDPALLDLVPPGTEIHRLPDEEPAARAGLRGRVDTLSGVPAPWIRWWVSESSRVALEAVADADVVVASCLPYETAFAGAHVAAQLGKPWVADLEDPWALDEMRLYPTGLHRARELRRMRSALSSASAVVMCAPEAAERVRRAMPEMAARVTAIPIGYEAEDFRGSGPRIPRGDGVLRIVHTGSMHTDLGLHLRRARRRRRLLGGTVSGVDILTRSHVFLVQAIAALERSDPSLRGRIELHLAGELTPGDRAVGDRHSSVRTPGLLSHRDTVALMRSADVLFLPMHDLPAGQRAGLIPYKTYEYLATGRPILAAVPDGDARELLSALSHAWVVRPGDIDGMVAALRAIAASPARSLGPDAVDLERVRELERRRCVARIAAVLDGVVSAPSVARAAA